MGGGGEKERILSDEKGGIINIYTYKESIMKLTKVCLKKWEWKYNGEGKLAQNALYTCIKLL
jgi:hypothetical protein